MFFSGTSRALRERAWINQLVSDINSHVADTYVLEFNAATTEEFLVKLVASVRKNCKHIRGCRVTEESITFISITEPREV